MGRTNLMTTEWDLGSAVANNGVQVVNSLSHQLDPRKLSATQDRFVMWESMYDC